MSTDRGNAGTEKKETQASGETDPAESRAMARRFFLKAVVYGAPAVASVARTPVDVGHNDSTLQPRCTVPPALVSASARRTSGAPSPMMPSSTAMRRSRAGSNSRS